MLKQLLLLISLFIFISCTGEISSGGEKDENGNADDLNLSISVSDSSLDFGSNAVGVKSSNLIISILNNGDDPIVNCFDASLSGDNSSEYNIENDSCGNSNLSVGASCQIEVSFTAASAGSKNASLNFSCNGVSASVLLASAGVNLNPPSIGANQNLNVNEDSSLAIIVNSAISNEGQSLSYSIVSGPSNGTLTNCMDQSGSTGVDDLSCNYQPNANYNGSDSFSYKANDGVDSQVAIVSISIASILDAPSIGVDQSASGNEDENINIDLNPATSNEGNALSYSIVSSPSNGVLSNCMDLSGSDGVDDLSCVYLGNNNFNGNDSFTYKVNDGLDSATNATVSIAINAVIDAPSIGANQSISTNVDTDLNFSLNTASSVDPYPLVYSVVSAPSNGVLSNCIGEAGSSTDDDLSCTYSPSNSFVGNDSFTYKVNNGEDSAIATVTIEVAAANDFVFKVQISSSNEQFQIPVRSTFNYNMNIDWGDNSSDNGITTWNDLALTHIYANPGIYTITISGTMENIYFNTSSHGPKVIEVVNLGDLGWKDLERAFRNCSNLASFAGGNTSQVTKMGRMFEGATSLTSIDVSSFDTSNVTDMSYMFYRITPSSLDVSNFNTAKVTLMNGMFGWMPNVTSITFGSGWDVSKVTSMYGMFQSNTELLSLDLSNFVPSSVTTFAYMFQNNPKLASLDISNFNTSSASSMEGMFQQTGSLAINLDLSHFDQTSLTSINSMFGSSALLSVNLNNWDISGISSYMGLWGGFSGSVYCDQGGSPGTGTLFGKTCN